MLVLAGQFVTVGAQDVIVMTSVWKYVDVESTGVATLPLEGTEGVVTTPSAELTEVGTLLLAEGEGMRVKRVKLAAAVLELAAASAAEFEALAVYDARIAELADAAAVTGQTVVSTVIVSVTTITFVADGWPAGQFVMLAAQLVMVWVSVAKTVRVV